jgi:hypothetical protein
VDYEQVVEQMRAVEMRCLYHNSGAFGFADSAVVQSLGWMGPEDPTVRLSARSLARQVPPPYEPNLTDLLVRAWRDVLPGKAWVMPRSHWSYELDFGSRDWLPAVLEHVGIDPGLLSSRNNGAAIEFTPQEVDGFSHLAQSLLRMLLGSDFAVAFPGRPVACTLHHHKQIWWTTSDREVFAALDTQVPRSLA